MSDRNGGLVTARRVPDPPHQIGLYDTGSVGFTEAGFSSGRGINRNDSKNAVLKAKKHEFRQSMPTLARISIDSARYQEAWPDPCKSSLRDILLVQAWRRALMRLKRAEVSLQGPADRGIAFDAHATKPLRLPGSLLKYKEEPQ